MKLHSSITPFEDCMMVIDCVSRDEALVRAGIFIGRGVMFSALGDRTEVLSKFSRGAPQDIDLEVIAEKGEE